MADWRPDWRDPLNYPFGKEQSNRWWLWQFVRRNARYQSAWEVELGRKLSLIERGGTDDDGPAALAELYEYDDGYWEGAVPTSLGPRGSSGSPGSSLWEETWGFSPCLDPAGDQLPWVVQGRTPGPRAGLLMTERGYVLSLQYARGRIRPLVLRVGGEDPRRWVAPLDLGRELEPQLRQIKKKATREQERLLAEGSIEVRQRKTQSGKWAFYLCLLDAEFAEASRRQIARKFKYDPVRPDDVLTDKLIGTRLKKATALTEPEGYLWEFFGLT